MDNEAESLVQKNATNNKLKLIGMAKTVKFLAAIDIFFSIYYCFTMHWACIFLSFLSWCGYYGSKKYNKHYVLGYIFCILIYTIIKSILIYYSNSIGAGIFNTISLIMEIYLLYIVSKFYNKMSKSNMSTFVELREGWEPRIISFVLV